MPILETIVCQTMKGKEARFERMVKARVELSKRQTGCINSWHGISNSDQYLYLIQTAYQDLEQFHVIKKLIEDTLDVNCLLYTSPSPRDRQKSRMPSSA